MLVSRLLLLLAVGLCPRIGIPTHDVQPCQTHSFHVSPATIMSHCGKHILQGPLPGETSGSLCAIRSRSNAPKFPTGFACNDTSVSYCHVWKRMQTWENCPLGFVLPRRFLRRSVNLQLHPCGFTNLTWPRRLVRVDSNHASGIGNCV